MTWARRCWPLRRSLMVVSSSEPVRSCTASPTRPSEPERTIMRRLLISFLAPLALLVGSPAHAAGPQVDVVIGPGAPRLERFAARELADQLQKLFDARVQVAEKVPATSDHLILVGSPATNPAVKEMAGERWPKLTDQGHVLRSVSRGERKALLVGGGSPVATLWAVYE